MDWRSSLTAMRRPKWRRRAWKVFRSSWSSRTPRTRSSIGSRRRGRKFTNSRLIEQEAGHALPCPASLLPHARGGSNERRNDSVDSDHVDVGRILEAQPTASRAMAVPRARAGLLPDLCDRTDLPIDLDQLLRLGRP